MNIICYILRDRQADRHKLIIQNEGPLHVKVITKNEKPFLTFDLSGI